MGITGLLQFIKDAGEPISVKKYKGQTVAVDTYCWLHKGAFSCAEKLAKGEPTDQYVWYCMKFVDMLLNFSVKPILVFDGRNLPSKHEVEKSRRERRETNLQKGRQLLREGKLSEARDCFTRCVNITPAMAHNLIKVARARGVDCVVAPYEADAQLAYLTKSGLAQAVITEDSDLLAFGCKKVILKMDKEGNGLEIDQGNLGRCRPLGNIFTEEKFRHMCILSGCDYLASLHGIGLGKACKLLRLAKDPDILKVIRKMGQYLKMSLVVPDEYIEGFIRANNTFLYQLVFDPVGRKVIPLNPYPEHIDPATLSYAGVNLGDEKGLQMAMGNVDINTLKKIDDFNPDKPMQQASKPRSHSWNRSPASTRSSIWSKGFKPGSAAPPQSAAASPDTPPSTRGKERVVSLDGLRLPCRELQVKRPREDSGISDQDVLQQYSAFSPKRSRSEKQPDKPTSTSQPRPRNRFATLLQRRNQETEEDGDGTCSRFFSSSTSADCVSTKKSTQQDSHQDVEPRSLSPTQDESPGTKADDSDAPDVSSVDTPSPPQSPNTTSPSSASQGLRLFNWTSSSPSTERSRTPKSTSGLGALQQFQYKKETFMSFTKTRSSIADPPPRLSSTEENQKNNDDLTDSPPSQDSAYFSQSQPHITSCPKEEVPTYSFPTSHQEDAACDMNSSKDPESEQSPTHSPVVEMKPSMMRSKVSGLSKPKSSSQGQAAKVGMLGPARASGLRKKKNSSTNNENSPGVQATISSLWKNFSFKKDSQKMTPLSKGKPMSPVKDNLLASSPQTDINVITSF